MVKGTVLLAVVMERLNEKIQILRTILRTSELGDDQCVGYRSGLELMEEVKQELMEMKDE